MTNPSKLNAPALEGHQKGNSSQWSGIPIEVKGVEEQSLAPRWLDKKEQAGLVRETEKVINASKTESAKIQGLRDREFITRSLCRTKMGSFSIIKWSLFR